MKMKPCDKEKSSERLGDKGLHSKQSKGTNICKYQVKGDQENASTRVDI